MNIFRILSSYDGSINEPNVSAFLAYLLDPSEDHGLSGILLQEFLGEFLKMDKSLLSKISYNGRITDLSRLSRFTITIMPEFTVYLNKENAKKKRDIDVLIEIYESGNDNPVYAVCVENKITDSSIIKNDSQLYDELEGLKNYYAETGASPEIYLVYLTPYPSDKSAESFAKLEYDKKIQMYWNDSENLVFNKINKIFSDESAGGVDPINDQSMYLIKSFQSFIRTGFKSYIEEKTVKRENNKYGRPVWDYLNTFVCSLEKDKTYALDEIKNSFGKFVKEQSGIELHKPTRDAYMLSAIVNERNRGNYNIKDPSDRRKNLFYYCNPGSKKEIRLFNPEMNRDIDVYYKNTDTDEIESKNASDV